MLEELQKDPWPVPADQRAARCTSTALSIAASLLGACFPGSGARIMAFVGGPSTEGPGAVRIVWFSLFAIFIMLEDFCPIVENAISLVYMENAIIILMLCLWLISAQS